MTHSMVRSPFAFASFFALTICLWTGCGQPPAETQLDAGDSMEMQARAKTEEARSRLSASDGGKVVLRAIEAHGGLEAWYRAPTSSYCWEYANVGGDLRFKSCLVADNATRRMYHDLQTLGTMENPEPVSGRFAWDGEQAWISPAEIDRINPRFWASTGYYFEQIPFVLADPGVNYEVLPDEQLDGVPHDMVKCSFDSGVGDAPGDTYTLYVNKDSGMVAAIRYTVTFYGGARPAAKKQQGPPRETLFRYEDYTEVDGLKVATHFHGSTFVDGQPGEFRNEAWCTDISFRQPFDESRLVMPPDGRVQPMPVE